MHCGLCCRLSRRSRLWCGVGGVARVVCSLVECSFHSPRLARLSLEAEAVGAGGVWEEAWGARSA